MSLVCNSIIGYDDIKKCKINVKKLSGFTIDAIKNVTGKDYDNISRLIRKDPENNFHIKHNTNNWNILYEICSEKKDTQDIFIIYIFIIFLSISVEDNKDRQIYIQLVEKLITKYGKMDEIETLNYFNNEIEDIEKKEVIQNIINYIERYKTPFIGKNTEANRGFSLKKHETMYIPSKQSPQYYGFRGSNVSSEGYGFDYEFVEGGTKKKKHFSKKHFSKKCHKILRRKCKKTLRRKCKKTLRRK